MRAGKRLILALCFKCSSLFLLIGSFTYLMTLHLHVRFDQRVIPPELHQFQPARNANIIFYNRVPKCGSSTLIKLLEKLAKRNRFTFVQSTVFRELKMSQSSQIKYANEVFSTQPPFLFEKHSFLIDFKSLGLKMPTYINIIRDPLDRLVSMYYYIRFKNPQNMSKADRNRSYDECVRLQMMECTEDHYIFQQLPFFCGQDDFCWQKGPRALEQAKRNVQKYYGVIGILENINATYQLLEKKYPRFFSGISKLFAGDNYKRELVNKKKKPLEETTKSLMKERLAEEYAFYKFVRGLFYNELKSFSLV